MTEYRSSDSSFGINIEYPVANLGFYGRARQEKGEAYKTDILVEF